MTAIRNSEPDTEFSADFANPGVPDLVPLDSLTAEHTGRWTFLILDGAAFMMQAMHPVIAEITGRYSAAFHGDQGGRAIRSIDSVLRWTYGLTEAVAEGNRVRAMHQPLTVKSDTTGKQISALNPEAYQWVIATGYIVTAQAGTLLIGREFTDVEKDELLRDNRRLARLLHVPMGGYPETREEMDRYFEEMIDKLEGTPQALKLVDEMRTGDVTLPAALPRALHPLARATARRGLRLNYLSIVGLLDPRLRAKLGVTWSPEEQRQLVRIYALIMTAYRVLPDRLTYFPLAYHARKHHECLEKMKERQKKSFAYRVPGSVAP
ncbi:oxygenase MpaB family protein [Mycolicibacterium sp. D5.8-2]|uniref:oxygenase MpaB family protein n=1 Tax=Mycolicibacterium sp. D5.8-2 TaxID=3085903 RepID=UPI00298D0678|nr:oxygenase MpaB family protein [Mycolicibacterium sp. D5.8-2]MDW5609798.1 oxygenase MpaB family protein [Mycolicibacterium sp. D5.8-2]